jgi:hypothetical protein
MEIDARKNDIQVDSKLSWKKLVQYIFGRTRQEMFHSRLAYIYDDAKSKLKEKKLKSENNQFSLKDEIDMEQTKNYVPYLNFLIQSEISTNSQEDIREISIEILCKFINNVFEQNLISIPYNNGPKFSKVHSIAFSNYEVENIKKNLLIYLELIERYKISIFEKDETKTTFFDFGNEKKLYQVLKLLKDEGIISENNKWNDKALKHRSRDFPVFIYKMKELDLVNFTNDAKFCDIASEFFGIKVNISTYNEIKKDGLNKNDKQVLDELSFLDIIK